MRYVLSDLERVAPQLTHAPGDLAGADRVVAGLGEIGALLEG